jgi:hypothetical protein
VRTGTLPREELRSAFSHPPLLRGYAGSMIAMSIVLFIWWPRGPVIQYIRGGTVPSVFAAVAIGLYACMAFIGARMGAGDYPPAGAPGLREIAGLRQVSLPRLAIGRLGAAILHTLFLAALGLPFLIAAAGVSGAAPGAAAAALLGAGCSSLAFRALGLLLQALCERTAVRRVLLAALSLLVILLPLTLLPRVSAVSAMLTLGLAADAGGGASMGAAGPGGPGSGAALPGPFVVAAPASAASVLAALLLSAAALAVLASARRAAGRSGP